MCDNATTQHEYGQYRTHSLISYLSDAAELRILLLALETASLAHLWGSDNSLARSVQIVSSHKTRKDSVLSCDRLSYLVWD